MIVLADPCGLVKAHTITNTMRLMIVRLRLVLPVLAEYNELFQEAVHSLEKQGGRRCDIDFTPFATVAKLLYESAFVAERFSGIRSFLEGEQVLNANASPVVLDLPHCNLTVRREHHLCICVMTQSFMFGLNRCQDSSLAKKRRCFIDFRPPQCDQSR